MVIDTSALIAVLLDEPERRRFNEAIEEAAARALSAANLVETSIVLETRLGGAGAHALDLFLERAEIEVVPVDRFQASMARSAFTRYGKGRHRAGLNYGDAFAYALAIARGEPLLFKGDDFHHTDVAVATAASPR